MTCKSPEEDQPERPLQSPEHSWDASSTGTPGLEFFLDLETRVWEALVNGDGAADGDLLSEDFLGVYPTGFSDRDGHVDQLSGGPTMSAFGLDQAQLTLVAADTVMLSYRARYRQPGRESAQTMYISSLWAQREGRWLNTFSQDTPAVE